MPDTKRTYLQLPERPYTGQIIFHGPISGRITLVEDRTISVVWSDGTGDAVVYPIPEQVTLPWER